LDKKRGKKAMQQVPTAPAAQFLLHPRPSSYCTRDPVPAAHLHLRLHFEDKVFFGANSNVRIDQYHTDSTNYVNLNLTYISEIF